MTKKVYIKIRGLHPDEEAEDDSVEVITVGTYAFRNGRHMVRYEEPEGDGDQTNSTVIKFTEREVEVLTKGTIGNHLLFTEGEKHLSYYETPFGSMNMSVEAYEVLVEVNEDKITIEISYGLEVNLDYVMNRKVSIEIEAIRE